MGLFNTITVCRNEWPIASIRTCHQFRDKAGKKEVLHLASMWYMILAKPVVLNVTHGVYSRPQLLLSLKAFHCVCLME